MGSLQDLQVLENLQENGSRKQASCVLPEWADTGSCTRWAAFGLMQQGCSCGRNEGEESLWASQRATVETVLGWAGLLGPAQRCSSDVLLELLCGLGPWAGTVCLPSVHCIVCLELQTWVWTRQTGLVNLFALFLSCFSAKGTQREQCLCALPLGMWISCGSLLSTIGGKPGFALHGAWKKLKWCPRGCFAEPPEKTTSELCGKHSATLLLSFFVLQGFIRLDMSEFQQRHEVSRRWGLCAPGVTVSFLTHPPTVGGRWTFALAGGPRSSLAWVSLPQILSILCLWESCLHVLAHQERVRHWSLAQTLPELSQVAGQGRGPFFPSSGTCFLEFLAWRESSSHSLVSITE